MAWRVACERDPEPGGEKGSRSKTLKDSLSQSGQRRKRRPMRYDEYDEDSKFIEHYRVVLKKFMAMAMCPDSSRTDGYACPCVCSEETKKKIAASKKGKKHSDETKSKISQAMSNRTLSMGHRFRISASKRGQYHSAETREKISESVHTTKSRLKKARLASRAAAAAEAATADLRHPYYYSKRDDDDTEQAEEQILDMIELERAVIEVTRLRDQLTSWMDLYESKHGKKPDLTETSESHPHVYGTFARYVALRELVRQSSLKIGFSPAAW